MIAEMCSLGKIIENVRSHGRSNRGVQAGFIAGLAFWLMALGAFSPQRLDAAEHVVSSEELRQHIRSARETREDQVREVRGFFSSEAVEKDLTAVGLDPAKIEMLVPLLDDDELARLAQRTRGIERDLAAGALNNQQLTYIVIALATAIVVILAT
jgi:hypothetical protein